MTGPPADRRLRADALFLYDDIVARRWRPFSLVRPVGELLFGTETLRARAERAFGVSCAAHLAGDALVGFDEPGAPRCAAESELGAEGRRLFVNSRFAPAASRVEASGDVGEGPSLLALGGIVVGALLPEGRTLPLEWLRSAATEPRDALVDAPPWPRQELVGALIESPWQLMSLNADRIREDQAAFEAELARGGGRGPIRAADRPRGGPQWDGVAHIGEGAVVAAPGATVEPGVVLDSTMGPILLAAGAGARAPARLEGPLYVGAGTTILGGAVGRSSIGPGCKVRGEIDASIVLGDSNKAHDGYLGHSVVGRWVNLGAMTTNSDLKISYGSVRVPGDGGARVDTGLLKAGCLVGDHARTGIGTLINAGTIVGAGSSVFGGIVPWREVPAFSWGDGGQVVDYGIERFLKTAAKAMTRRGRRLSPSMKDLYRTAWHRSAQARYDLRARAAT